MTLTELGFGPFSARLPAGAWPARIVSEHRGALEAHDGVFLHSIPPHPQAAVGDWVHLREGPDGLHIVHIAERINAVQRKAAGAFTGRQTVAANLDRVFIVTSMNRDLKLSRIERFLVATRGIPTTVVLNKADQGPVGPALVEIKALGCDAVATSALTGVGLEQLRARMGPGRTSALVGTSGVGKSSLLNALAGQPLMDTGDIRHRDARGRHTTTRRQLFVLPGLGAFIDTPGMRELALTDEADPTDAFADLEALAVRCRYRSCQHDGDEGCAIDAAVAEGQLTPRRVNSWFKLKHEAAEAKRRHERHLAKKARERQKKTMARIAERDRWRTRRGKRRRRRCRTD